MVIDDIDEDFLQKNPKKYETCREQARHWQGRARGLERRLVMVRESDGDVTDLAAGERICGPVCPKRSNETPLVAWTQRFSGSWELKYHNGKRPHTVLGDSRVIRNPQISVFEEKILFACERDTTEGKGEVLVLSENGDRVISTEGRNLKLVTSSKGIALLTEEISENRVSLVIHEFDGLELARTTRIEGGDDYTFNADLAYNALNDELLVVAENCPAFGMDDRVGMHRYLKVWSLDGGGDLRDLSGETGRLPIKPRAFNYWSTENTPPIRPHIYLQNGKTSVSFRQFRYSGFKAFGWDVYRLDLIEGDWSSPVRMTPNRTTPDTGYAVLPTEEGYLGVFPCIDNPGGSTRCSNFRVEIVELDRDDALPRVDIKEAERDEYLPTTGYRNVAPTPPALEETYMGRTLIWGDLHPHTNYSKCVSAADGCPNEMFRYARDVLGCQVFTFIDHSNMLGGPESTWVNDQLEILAGGRGIPIFGAETGMSPGRHTNWYAYDRDTFDQLRCILNSQGTSRENCYRQVREELPEGSVMALRHFHGGMEDEKVIMHSFEPRLEPAMEAMQGRINALIKPSEKYPRFPNQFLTGGARIGLVGGTDHYRGNGPNHFCLTGFWVKEITPKGVWEALRNRYTIAMSDSKVSMAAWLDGQPAGSTVTMEGKGTLSVSLSASCGHEITRATLIRDGEILPWTPVKRSSATIELEDNEPSPGFHWYVPTIEVRTAYGSYNRGYGHSSPFLVMVR